MAVNASVPIQSVQWRVLSAFKTRPRRAPRSAAIHGGSHARDQGIIGCRRAGLSAAARFCNDHAPGRWPTWRQLDATGAEE